MPRNGTPQTNTVHVIPVFAPSDEAGWLVYTGRRSAAIARDLDTLGEDQCSWESPVRSWFFKVESTGRALDALTSASYPNQIVLCASCLAGNPCSRWMKVPRSGFTKRDPADDGDVSTKNGTEWWREYSRPAPGAESPHVESDDEDPIPLSEMFEVLFGVASDRVKKWRKQRRQAPPRQRPAVPMTPMGMTPHEAAALIGIRYPCSSEELAIAYKKAAFAEHPDRGGSTEKMSRINAARDVLRRTIES
jgi:hypothetical protein